MSNDSLNKVSRKSDFLSSLEERRNNYIEVLEALFGPCDPRFVPGRIKRTTHVTGQPQTDYPFKYQVKGDCVVDIHISPEAYDNQYLNQATWQVAHECVHMLDPCRKGEANILEEGLAVWFQDEESYHPDFVQKFIRRNPCHHTNYAEAKELVSGCMPELVGAVFEIRSRGLRLQNFEPRLLSPLLASVRDSVLIRLCEPFEST